MYPKLVRSHLTSRWLVAADLRVVAMEGYHHHSPSSLLYHNILLGLAASWTEVADSITAVPLQCCNVQVSDEKLKENDLGSSSSPKFDGA